MTRTPVGFGLLMLAACSGSRPQTTPAPAGGPAAAATPAAAAPRAGGRGPGGAAPVQPLWTRYDTASYVRKTAPTDPVIQRMYAEGMARGQAGTLAQVLFDSIGPRLTGSPGYHRAADWMTKMYSSWGIAAKQEQYGTWNSWRRGVTHIDLTAPRVRSLEGTMLGWSPGTGGKAVEGRVVLFPKVTTPEAFATWARANAKGAFILMSAPNPSCRTSAQWDQFGQDGARASIDSMRRDWTAGWADRTKNGGNQYTWPAEYGAAGVITTNWSQYPGVNKVFGSWRQQVPTMEASCEDYNLLYRLADNNQGPMVRVTADAEMLGEQPMFNVIGQIRGSEKPNEYIVLSAHFDSWDGASGATDNGTGTITMMEAMRILKTVYPTPKRTILVGHWGGEEQGLNGSQAFVLDNPAIVAGVRAGFNQDGGTGRVTSIGPGPFSNAVPAMPRWLTEIPSSMSGWIRIGGVSPPSRGGTDQSSFQCAKAPVFGLGAVGWDYSNLTWHTNRDTYDKVVIEDLKNNATLVAMLAYLADRDEALGAPVAVTSTTNAEGVATPTAYSCPTPSRKTSDSQR
ncbi:MAG: M28 family peptidase [Gemmatimonadales bacterium]